ncbi:MAG TPA: amino acid racemase [Mobilitalea sp.]|mgnify:CR=1 FL=1|nr:amino acid racemase [Mobilitalea sp.]
MPKKLGVIGGLGPLATAYFYELICRMTDANKDQEHLDMIIIGKSSIPDRTEYILGKSTDSPLPHLKEAARTLEIMEVDYIAIPCITAHYFYRELSESIKVPIIHIIKETVRYLKNRGVKSAGIMATEGTIKSNLFQKELHENGINPVIPSKIGQKYISDIIFNNVKAGIPVDMENFKIANDELLSKGADTIILGCTELSLLKRTADIGPGFIDALEVLAMCCINKCERPIRREFSNLIT